MSTADSNLLFFGNSMKSMMWPEPASSVTILSSPSPIPPSTGVPYGTPVEGGMGLGLDRIVTLLAGSGHIMDFILFPKNKRFESAVDMSPTNLDSKRLKNDYGLEFKDV